jgi:arylsulfatase A-like enzyme
MPSPTLAAMRRVPAGRAKFGPSCCAILQRLKAGACVSDTTKREGPLLLRHCCSRLALLVLLAAVAGACRGRAARERESLEGYNVILINVDTLRADHLGLYGYARDTSPFLDSLAAQSIVYNHARSNSSYTRESVSALFSGRLPSRSGSWGWGARPANQGKNLAELFQRSGYATGFFDATTVLTDPMFTRGFTEVGHISDAWGQSQTGRHLSERALGFAAAHRNEKFMMYLHYLDPHGPYDPPEALYRRFRPTDFPNPVDVYRDVRPNFDRFVKEGFGPGDPRFEDMVVRYDAEIADTDQAIETLFHGLKDLHLLDRTLIVITADHGEEFMEHGFIEHAWTLYRESVHVPLIVWAGDALKPSRIDARVSTVDILPTLLELTRLPDRALPGDGATLLTRAGKPVEPRSPSKPLIAELLISERNVLRTVVNGKWKYVAAQRWLEPALRPQAAAQQQLPNQSSQLDVWGPVVHEELYDLEADPGERQNCIATCGPAIDEMRGLLETYHASTLTDGGPDASGHDGVSSEDIERLRALGYVH